MFVVIVVQETKEIQCVIQLYVVTDRLQIILLNNKFYLVLIQTMYSLYLTAAINLC